MRLAVCALAVAVMALPALVPIGALGSQPRRPALADSFSRPHGRNRLITNQYAFFNRHDPAAVRSARWEMSSGSLFSRRGVGWSGRPDLTRPNASSRNGTGSAVFRLRTRRSDFRNVRVKADVRVLHWSATRPRELPAVVLWVRYASPRRLYWPSVLRADGRVEIAKKVPGGPHPVNGGTYYTLPPYTSAERWPVRLRRWYHMAVTVRTGHGKVTIATYRDGRLMQRGVDRGPGQVVRDTETGDWVTNPTRPIFARGRLGVRADNADFELRNYRVYRLP